MPAYLKRACACGPRQMVRRRSRRSALPSPVEARAAAPPRRPAGTGIPAYVRARALVRALCVRVFTARAVQRAPSGAPQARRAIRASTGTIRTCARASDPALRATYTWHGTHTRDRDSLQLRARAPKGAHSIRACRCERHAAWLYSGDPRTPSGRAGGTHLNACRRHAQAVPQARPKMHHARRGPVARRAAAQHAPCKMARIVGARRCAACRPAAKMRRAWRPQWTARRGVRSACGRPPTGGGTAARARPRRPRRRSCRRTRSTRTRARTSASATQPQCDPRTRGRRIRLRARGCGPRQVRTSGACRRLRPTRMAEPAL
jgi:hypothetical protein